MKSVSVTVLLLFCTFSLYPQTFDLHKDSWERIIISDSYAGWSHFNNQFEIKRIHGELILTNARDSTIGKINQGTLDKFFESLKNEEDISKDPLKIFGKDSIWLIDNAEKIWFSYLGDKNEPSEIDSFAINTAKDYGKIKRVVWGIQGFNWTDDYPFTSVLILNGSDTLRIHSSGQYPFMMPWNVKGKAIYNSVIPSTISNILPWNIRSNRFRLSGERFDFYLMDRIYKSFIEDYRDHFIAKLRYPNQFAILEQYYRISNAKLADMGSIEWGGFISAPCLKMQLKSKEFPDNISFSVILGRRIKLHSVRPIIKKQNGLKSQIVKNHVYQYTIKNPSTTGKIHFVNKRSLSGQAKRNFKNDLKDNGMKRNMFMGRYRNAVFYELTEDRDNAQSFSRWIFLKDGTTILWEIQGNYLMDFKSDIVKEKGYICRVITDND
jgi:hypothetical protein